MNISTGRAGEHLERERVCPGCGKPVIRIKTTAGRTLVDAEPVWIRMKPGGEAYILPDGRAVFGDQAGDADDDPDANFIEGYIPHLSHCENHGRAPRQRRRPSGYR